MIEIKKARKAFAAYVRNYDASDEQIALKIKHTFEVMNYALLIAKDLHLTKEQSDLAELIALLHDIGRFEQVRQYHTFIDADSIDHAKLGVEVLQNHQLIREFVEEGYDEIIFQAILNHNRYQIEAGLSKEALLQARIIRDADKTDILRVNNENSCETLFMCSEEEMCASLISDDVLQDFMAHHSILSSKRKTPADILVSHIALLYDFNFPTGLSIIAQKGWIPQMLHRFDFHQSQMKEMIQMVEQEALDYMKQTS